MRTIRLHHGSKVNPTAGGIAIALRQLAAQKRPHSLLFTDTNEQDYYVLLTRGKQVNDHPITYELSGKCFTVEGNRSQVAIRYIISPVGADSGVMILADALSDAQVA